VSFGGFTSSIIAMFTNHIGWLDFVLNYATSAIVFISDFFSRLPNALASTTEPAQWKIFIYYALITCVTLLIKSFDKKLAAACVFFALLLIPIKLPDKNLEIIAFDVQNADMFLVQTPENKYFMVDTGKSGYNTGSSKAKYILLPYLIDHGIKDIESIIITHFDNDHSGGVVDILEGVNVKQVYLNSYDDKSYTSRQIYAKLRNSALARNNEVIYEEPELSMKTFVAPRNSKAKHDNENSIVILLSYKDFDMLFTGDAGVEAFGKLNIPSGIDVLKVGHHGGDGAVNAKMLGHLGTAVSVISTGTNPYGHPAKSTLDILSSTDIYRTDLDNSVKIVTDGKTYKVYTYDIAQRKYILNRTYVCPSNSTAQDISSNLGSH
jgi:competence protein ComEC